MAALNIKDDELVRMVRELAAEEGKSMAAVVREAIQERRARGRTPRMDEAEIQYWLERGAERRAHASPEWLATDINDVLYDEHGLPK